MKNVILFACLLAIAATALWVLRIDETASLDPKSVIAASALVTPLSADVSLQSAASNTQSEIIFEPSEAPNESTVRTSAEGRALISVNNDIVSSLDNNSQITLELSQNKRISRLALMSGNIWSKVSRALEQDEVFEVYTPTMVAAVRGTSFGVSMDSSKSLIVTEGVVTITRRDPGSGERLPETSIEVIAGKTVEDTGQSFVVRETTDTDRDAWYQENNDGTPSEQTTDARLDTSNLLSDISITATEPPSHNEAPSTSPRVAEPEPTIVVTEISPDTFAENEPGPIRLRGTNLETVTEIRINGSVVPFQVTGVGVILIDVDEFRDGPRIYDIEILSPSQSLTLENAVEMTEATDPALTIDEVYFDSSQQVPIVIVTGTGLERVDTLLINNEPVQFQVRSDSELYAEYQFIEQSQPVEVRAGNQIATDTINP
jgi:hypothetical protein